MNPAQAIPQDMLQLRDIHLPLSPDIWPPAPGWWLLATAVLGFLVWITIRLLRLWRRHRLQKEILTTLDDLRQYSDEQITQFLAEISILLRRVAIMKFPRQQVAALTGKEWLSFLDLHGGDGEYSNGIGRVLADGPYARPGQAGNQVDKNALLSLARKWIKRNTRS